MTAPSVKQATQAIEAGDGHRFELITVAPDTPRRGVLWLPALGVAARHYLPLAHALASRGVAVALHEWRGHGSSSLRASRRSNWGYRALLEHDVPASTAALCARWPALPLAIGGHSLGGQLAACQLALAPGAFDALWLVASGAPYWRAFPAPLRYGLPLAYRFMPWLAHVNGVFPGRRLGFGGNEAAGVMRDWSRTALSGCYAARGIDMDLERALAAVDVPITAVGFGHDWLAPASSLRFLLDKMPAATSRVQCLDPITLGVRDDHFAWMQAPDAVVDVLVGHRRVPG